MKYILKFKIALDFLLKKEKLNYMKKFFETNSFEEIPIYSKYRNLNFFKTIKLKRYRKIDFNKYKNLRMKNIVLLNYAIIHLDKIIKYSINLKIKNYISLITITNWNEYKLNKYPIQPNFWVCSKREEILPYIILTKAYTKEAFEVIEYLKKCDKYNKYVVLDYSRTIKEKEECFRVFIIPEIYINYINISNY